LHGGDAITIGGNFTRQVLRQWLGAMERELMGGAKFG
jgi:hypothetical protein